VNSQGHAITNGKENARATKEPQNFTGACHYCKKVSQRASSLSRSHMLHCVHTAHGQGNSQKAGKKFKEPSSRILSRNADREATMSAPTCGDYNVKRKLNVHK